jgi:hypothetical protein
MNRSAVPLTFILSLSQDTRMIEDTQSVFGLSGHPWEKESALSGAEGKSEKGILIDSL